MDSNGSVDNMLGKQRCCGYKDQLKNYCKKKENRCVHVCAHVTRVVSFKTLKK